MTRNINMAALFPEIDENETASKVMDFFKVTYPKMRRVAGRNVTDLKSPMISDMPKAAPIGNTTEETIIRRMVAGQVVNQTREAIYHCDNKSSTILKLLYLTDGQYTDEQVWQRIGYEKTQYYYYKKIALLCFADAYLLEDLHCYKK